MDSGRGGGPRREDIMQKVIRREEREETRGRRWLPDEITMEILSRLPVKSIIRLRGASKLWSSITQDHHFIHMHLARSFKAPRIAERVFSLDHHETKLHIHSLEDGKPVLQYIVSDSRLQVNLAPSSANGLLCLHSRQSIVVCNPATRDLVTLPLLETRTYTREANLGFHPPTQKYKLVRLFSEIGTWRTCAVAVLTLGSTSDGTWRTIGEINFDVIDSAVCVVNGVMYRVVIEEDHRGSAGPCSEPVLLSVDLGSEDIGIVKLPPTECNIRRYLICNRGGISLAELNGKLCCGYLVDAEDGGLSNTDVFQISLLLDSGWNKMCSIVFPQVSDEELGFLRYLRTPSHPPIPPTLIWVDDGIVLLKRVYSIFCYDVPTGVLDWKPANALEGASVCVYVESLVSVDSG